MMMMMMMMIILVLLMIIMKTPKPALIKTEYEGQTWPSNINFAQKRMHGLSLGMCKSTPTTHESSWIGIERVLATMSTAQTFRTLFKFILDIMLLALSATFLSSPSCHMKCCRPHRAADAAWVPRGKSCTHFWITSGVLPPWLLKGWTNQP